MPGTSGPTGSGSVGGSGSGTSGPSGGGVGSSTGGSVGAEPPTTPSQASAAGGARAAALASVLGTGVDAKPVYGAFAIGGILGLALLLAMRGVTGGANR